MDRSQNLIKVTDVGLSLYSTVLYSTGSWLKSRVVTIMLTLITNHLIKLILQITLFQNYSIPHRIMDSRLKVTACVFVDAANRMLSRANMLDSIPPARRFRALFGVQPHICAIILNQLCENNEVRRTSTHFLWVCMFLKVHATEEVHCTIGNVNCNTFRNWAWYYILVSSFGSVIIRTFFSFLI